MLAVALPYFVQRTALEIVGTDAVNRVVHATVADFRLETLWLPAALDGDEREAAEGDDGANAGGGAGFALGVVHSGT